MRYVALFLLVIVFACTPRGSSRLQRQVDSLQARLDNSYKPGFGEFMSSIQVHHNKLWFAGKNQNWPLADFEMHEITETLDAIRKYQSERPESEKVSMLQPAMDSVGAAIREKNLAAFTRSYVLLTNTCNDCHKATDFGFNKVKVPDTPPFSNQAF